MRKGDRAYERESGSRNFLQCQEAPKSIHTDSFYRRGENDMFQPGIIRFSENRSVVVERVVRHSLYDGPLIDIHSRPSCHPAEVDHFRIRSPERIDNPDGIIGTRSHTLYPQLGEFAFQQVMRHAMGVRIRYNGGALCGIGRVIQVNGGPPFTSTRVLKSSFFEHPATQSAAADNKTGNFLKFIVRIFNAT